MRDFFVAIIFLAYSLPLLAYEIAPHPAWVEDYSKNIQAVPSNENTGASTLYHLVDRQLYFDGDTHSYYRFISTPINSRGLDENGKLNIVFSEAYQKVNIHHIRVVRNGKTLNLLKKVRIREFRTEDQVKLELYNGYLTVNVLIKDLRIGDKLDIGYSIIGSNPILGHFFSSAYTLAWDVPVEKLSVRVIDNSNSKIYSHSINTAIEPTMTKTKWGTEHRVELSPTPTFQSEKNTPANVIQGPIMSFSNIDSWQEISDWGQKLFQYSGSRQSREWHEWKKDVGNEANPEAKVLKALKLVQDQIRYVGIEVGENSHKPRDPSEVIDNRYGDCKDKTLLLVSLLRSNGIEANPVFVSLSNRGGIKHLSPSIIAFDHVIVEATVNGKKYWLDGTAGFQDGSKIEQLGYANYEYGLALSEPADLSAMPTDNFLQPKVQLTEKYYIRSHKAPTYLEINAKYSGSKANQQRSYFNTYSAQSISRKYQEFYSKSYDSVVPAKKVGFFDSKEGNSFSTNEGYLISNFVKSDKKGNPYYSVWPTDFRSYLTAPEITYRKTPFNIGAPIHVTQRIEVYYPIKTNFFYEPVKITHKDKYREIEIKTWDIGQKSVYEYTYKSFKYSVPPKDISDHKKMINNALEDLDYSYQLRNYSLKGEDLTGALYKRLDEEIGGVNNYAN